MRRKRGILLLVTVLLCALALGLLINQFHIRLLMLVLLILLLPVRPTWDVANEIAKALRKSDIVTARFALRDTVWRHHALLDDHGLARAASELLAVHYSEKILGPVFWYMVLGAPGFLIAKALYLLKETLCQPLHAGNGFSQPIVTLHRIVNFMPARLAALLWFPVMIFLPLGHTFSAINNISKAIASAMAPEEVSVLAMAAVLGVSLGGPTSVYTAGKWLGTGSAKADAADVKRGLYLFGLLQLFSLVILYLFVIKNK